MLSMELVATPICEATRLGSIQNAAQDIATITANGKITCQK